MKLGLNTIKNNRATPSLSSPKRGEGGRRPGEGESFLFIRVLTVFNQRQLNL
jgi:hypothetical protein